MIKLKPIVLIADVMACGLVSLFTQSQEDTKNFSQMIMICSILKGI